MIVKNLCRLALAALALGSLGCGSLGRERPSLQSRRVEEYDRLNEQAGMPDAWQGRYGREPRVYGANSAPEDRPYPASPK